MANDKSPPSSSAHGVELRVSREMKRRTYAVLNTLFIIN